MRLRDHLCALPNIPIDYRSSISEWPQDLLELIRGRIASLHIGVIKSLPRLSISEARIGENGLITTDGKIEDRKIMLAYVKGGNFQERDYSHTRLSQREVSEFSLIKMEYDGKELAFGASGMDDLFIPIDELYSTDSSRIHSVRIGDEGVFNGIPQEGHFSEWIRSFLRQNRSKFKDIDVLIAPQGFSQQIDDIHRCGQNTGTLYTDGGQILIANEETLNWINRKLKGKHGPDFREIAMSAFGPNIVIDGLPPNVEDIIALAQIYGEEIIQLLFGGLSVRCKVTTVDENGNHSTDGEPLSILGETRPRRKGIELGFEKNSGKPTFAVNAIAPEGHIGKIIRVGSSIRIPREKTLSQF